MPNLDTTAAAQVAAPVFAPAWFIWLDIVGDPIRATTYGQAVTFSGTGDADLDGQTFAVPTDRSVISVGDVSFTESGSDSVSIFLSGIDSIDSVLMNAIGNRANWQGRTARLWLMVCDPSGAPQGGVAAWYTGIMAAVDIHPSPTTQTIELRLENFVALIGQASNRSYLGQADYDPADTSAAATLAAANNARGAAGATVGGGGSSFGVGGGAGIERQLVSLD